MLLLLPKFFIQQARVGLRREVASASQVVVVFLGVIEPLETKDEEKKASDAVVSILSPKADAFAEPILLASNDYTCS